MKKLSIFVLIILICSQLSSMNVVKPYIDDAQVERDSEQVISLFKGDIDLLYHAPEQFNPEYVKWEIGNKRVHSVWPIKEEDYEHPFYQKVLRSNLNLLGIISYIVAKEDGRLQAKYGEKGKEAWLWQFCVGSNFRRKGYGQKMLESSLMHLKELGVETVRVFVRDYNDPCISLCKKIGFEQYEAISVYHSCLFRKKL